MHIERIKRSICEFSIKNSIEHIQGEIYHKGKSYEVSNKENSRKLIFEIGSLTKIITAFTVLIACNEDKLNLDLSLEDIFKKRFLVHESMSKIKIIDILTHSSGFPNLPSTFIKKMSENNSNPYSTLTKEMVMNYLQEKQDIRLPNYCYSNFGYGLLGIILEEVYHLTYDKIIDLKVFNQLGMLNSSINIVNPANTKNLAQGYDCKGEKINIWEDYCLGGGGSILSTAADFSKFLSFHFNDSPFNQILISMLIPKTNKMAIGWHRHSLLLKCIGFNSFYWHNGLVGGCASYSTISLKKNSSLIILANKGISIDNLGIEIMSYLR